MKVTLDLEQSVWTAFLMRAHEEKLSPDDVIGAWLRRAIRQERSIQPGAEPAGRKVVEIGR